MALYAYKGIDAQRSLQSGTTEAASLEALTQSLKTRGIFLMEAKLVMPATPHRLAEAPAVSRKTAEVHKPIKSVPLNTLTIFTSELYIMLRTGLPLSNALHTLAQQQRHPGFKQILIQISRSVQEGNSMSHAFSAFPQIFDSIYLALLSSGEAGGKIPEMLERLSLYLAFRRELRSKVQSALMYPLMIMLTGFGVVLFLVIFILPNFAAMFNQMGTELPLPTRMLLGISHHLRSGWWVYVLLAGGAGFWLRQWLSAAANTLTLERAKLRLPVLGQLIRNIVMTRVLRTLGALVASGVPILDSLKLAGEAASHPVFYDILVHVRQNASEGKGLATALTGDPFFPEMAADMIANAELTGTLPEVMDHISAYYEKETDISIRNVFALAEPVFVIVMGLMVGAVAVAILLPMFRISGEIG